MADHKIGEMDITAQEKAYEGFVNFTKWSVIWIIALLIAMAIFIV